MSIPNNHKYRYFYHFTHLANLDSVIKNGLLSTSKKIEMKLSHIDVANQNIQGRRHTMPVSCSPRGTVHDYVPFYFASRNPMLLSVLHTKKIDQVYLVFLAVSIEKLEEENVIFTNASANTDELPIFFNDPKELDQLHWNLIDSLNWGNESDIERHRSMAEVLVQNHVPFNWVENIIVYKPGALTEVNNILNANGITGVNVKVEPLGSRYFFYNKFMFGRPNESIVTGPEELIYMTNETIKRLIDDKKTNRCTICSYDDLEEFLNEVEKNFCVITELENIDGLETSNPMHSETVSNHTKSVVNNLTDNEYYINLKQHDRMVVKLSAYLHDIGKGPATKWRKKIQETYSDHPADALPMIERIIKHEIKDISETDIRKICILVAYHDILGDIIANGRNLGELVKLDLSDNELTMLKALSLADISSISVEWSRQFQERIDSIC